MSSQEPPSEQPKEPPSEQPKEEAPLEEQPGEEAPTEEQPGEEGEVYEAPPEQPRPESVAPQMPPPEYPPQGYPGPQGYRPPPQGYAPPQGYPPPQGYYAGPAVAPRRRTSPWLGCLIAFIVVLFLCGGLAIVGTLLGFGFGVGGALRNSATEPARTFSVTGSPAALILTSDAGSITINRGNTNRIVVLATKYANFGGNLKDVTINYSQSGDTVNVTVNRSGTFNFFNSTSVDFTITAPPTTDLQITTNAGSINVSGIRGKMSLISNAGSIGATQATLADSSTFRTNAGSINFNGSITAGMYDFETNAGSIDMTLSGPANFHLNATTDVGTINTSFPVTVNHSGAGATANGDIGTPSQATLTLRTNAGSITLNRG